MRLLLLLIKIETVFLKINFLMDKEQALKFQDAKDEMLTKLTS